MRHVSRCTPVCPRGGSSESSRCLWPIRTKHCAAGLTPGVVQGGNISRLKHQIWKFLISRRVESGRVQNPRVHTERHCQSVQLNVRMCVHGQLRNETGWKFVSLLNLDCQRTASVSTADLSPDSNSQILSPPWQQRLKHKLRNSCTPPGLVTVTSPPLTLRGRRVTKETDRTSSACSLSVSMNKANSHQPQRHLKSASCVCFM